jgi:alginate O-acetyltransferase complex protein AlgI
MLFNTAEYFVFFVIVLTISWLVAGHRQVRLWFILAASLYFYTSNNHWQVLLLLLTTTMDYLLCIWLSQIEDRAQRKLLLAVSVCSNLGLLAYFKYFNFFGQSITSLYGFIGLRLDWVDLNVALPVGISFYTFEALSYTIDVYRGKIPAQRQWNRLAFLVSFFPHLIAGPIVRAADFFPQMDRKPWLSRREFELALYLIVAGLVKKIVFADTLSYFADVAFDENGKIGAFAAWVGVYAFAFQIYFDFSGYTDIALGSAKLLGFQLPDNFNYPYAASSITDFWRRWHISLSTWLRDYVYISLGGNRMRTQLGVYRNLMLTMLLGGAWHGAAFHFIIWGGLHGALLSFERALTGGIPLNSVPALRTRILRNIWVFQLIVFLWIPFRANSVHAVDNLLSNMFSSGAASTLTFGQLIVLVGMGLAWVWQILAQAVPVRGLIISSPLPLKAVGYAALALLVVTVDSNQAQTFIYFRF